MNVDIARRCFAFALAAVCPFTAIYVATILTEVSTNFLAMAMVLAANLALKLNDWGVETSTTLVGSYWTDRR